MIDLLTLAAGELRLVLAPQVGGSIAAFTRQWREGANLRELHWLRPATASALAACNPLDMASFPLLPFCNRIRDGRSRFEGREIRMPPNHPRQQARHPLHGIGWLRPWTVVRAGEAEAVLELAVPASDAWPWRFLARQDFALREDALQVTVSVRNEDTAAMPLGLGHHPYFPHPSGTRLTCATQAMWRTDVEVMPTTLETGSEVQALRQGVVLETLDLDNNFTGWEGRARIDWPQDAQGPARYLVLEAEPPLEYFVLYCPRGLGYFCAEPVSQCTDWLHLLPRYGHGPLGGMRLEPGAQASARFVLRAGALQSRAFLSKQAHRAPQP